MVCRLFNQHVPWQTEEKREHLVRMVSGAAEILPHPPYPYFCIHLFDVVLSFKAHFSLLLCSSKLKPYFLYVPMTRRVLNLVSVDIRND